MSEPYHAQAYENYGAEVQNPMQEANFAQHNSVVTTDGVIKLEQKYPASNKAHHLGVRRFMEVFWDHFHENISYCLVFWGFGMCVAFLGPTLLDLGCKTENEFRTMSWVFFAQSFFTLFGSACAGYLAQKFTPNGVLFAGCFMSSFTLATIPMCLNIYMLALILAIMGFFMGTIDTTANLCMIQMYKKSVAPFLQSLHFFYGLGAFVSPMITEPFLLNEDCTPMVINATYYMYHENNTVQAKTLKQAQELSKIQYAFWILAAFQLPVLFLIYSIIKKKENDQTEAQNMNSMEFKERPPLTSKGMMMEAKDSEAESLSVTKSQVYIIWIFTALTIFLFDGLQATYGAYIYSYAVKSVNDIPASRAALLNACYWGFFAFGRFASIGLATWLAPSLMLFCNICGCMLAMTILSCFPNDHSALFLGTILFGTFLSSIYPTSVSLAEKYISLSYMQTTTMVVAAAAGEMLLPVIIGHEFDEIGPRTLLTNGLVVTISSFFIYIVIFLTGASIVRNSSEPPATFKELIKSYIPGLTSGSGNEESGLMKHRVKHYSRMKSELSENSIGDEDENANQ